MSRKSSRVGLCIVALLSLILANGAIHTRKASAASLPSNSPITAAFVSSEQGDFVGGGNNYSFSKITYDLQDGGVAFNATDSAAYFTFIFLPPAGQSLLPGTYVVTGSPGPSQPQLDVFGNSHGCDYETGWFTIDDATYDSSGNILSFSVRFEQHCGVSEAALFGALSYQSTAPYRTRTVSPTNLAFTSPSGGPVTQTITITNNGPSTLTPSYALAGANPGDFNVTTTCPSSLAAKASCAYKITYTPGIAETSAATFEYFDELSPLGPPNEQAEEGTGWHIPLSATNSAYQGSLPALGPAYMDSESGNGLVTPQETEFTSVTYLGSPAGYPRFQLTNDIGAYAEVTLAPPAGAPLVPGTYNDAESAGGQDPGDPGLDVTYGDEGCNTVAGRFIVDDATYDGSGNVVTFAARFEAHCEGGPGAIFGFISYNSPVTYPTRTVSANTLTLSTVGGPVTQSVTITNYGPTPDSQTGFSISGGDASSFALSHNTCTGTLAAGTSCSVSVTYTPASDSSTSTSTLYFTDTLAPLGPPNEPAGAGEGRAIGLSGSATLAQVDCLYNGTNHDTPVANVTQGSSISIDCTGFPAFDTVAAGEGSPLYLNDLDPSDLDPNLQFFTTDGSGNLNATFIVPNPFVAGDPSAVCPPTASQVSEGYFRCFLVLADQFGNGDIVPLDYALPSPATTPSGGSTGYWMVGSDGGVFAFGDAPYLGSLPGLHVHVDNIRAVVPTADGKGYWMVGSDGGVFAFGDAPYLGSLPGLHVHVDNIVGVVPG